MATDGGSPPELVEAVPVSPVPRGNVLGAMGVGVALYGIAVALVILIAGRTYGFFALTDIGYYRSVAEKMALGLQPYVDFPLEYPPLAALLLRLPHGLGFSYPYAFAAEMLLVGGVTAAVVAATAARVWTRPTRLVAPLAFAVGITASGAITANRFDIAVALVFAAAVHLLIGGRHLAAAALLGLGFSLKVTPVVLVPLVVMMTRRRWSALAAFTTTAVLPFVPFLGSPHLGRMFLFHAERPLQFESVLATPFLVSHVLGLTSAKIANAYGSQMVVANGADLVALLSGPLQATALGLTYGIIVLRRRSLRAENLALPVFAVLLAFLAPGKVLSPQFLIWLLPAAALLSPRYRVLTGLFLGALVLTQLEFPSLFRSLVALRPLAVSVVGLRNLVIVATWLLALVHLWRLPRSEDPQSSAR